VMAAKGYWISPGGKTPATTLYSALARVITTKWGQQPLPENGSGQVRSHRRRLTHPATLSPTKPPRGASSRRSSPGPNGRGDATRSNVGVRGRSTGSRLSAANGLAEVPRHTNLPLSRCLLCGRLCHAISGCAAGWTPYRTSSTLVMLPPLRVGAMPVERSDGE
jgi:hypothetical protein